MKLTHFFRLIVMSIFQTSITKSAKSYQGQYVSYDNQYFYCPKIHCKDGFNVSLQINNGNYCESENGYRELGVDWKEVEFGFPSMNDKDMFQYSEMYNLDDMTDFDVTGTVGRIPVDVMQTILDNHGGIDWDATLSIESANKFIGN